MNNGDDSVLYLRQGFRVVAIEADPGMVEQCARRFHQEIKEGQLTILNVAISDQEGILPFWICDSHPEWSSFDRSIASRDGAKHHRIEVLARPFQSILQEYGVPYYLKLDIEGSEIYCLRALSGSDLPRYVSFEKTEDWSSESLAVLRELGYTGFKLISQFNFLPIEYPPSPEQVRYEKVHNFLRTRNPFVRILRKCGGRRLLMREIERTRVSSDGWVFPNGSSGNFGEHTSGKWQSFEEIIETLERASCAWRAKSPSVFWTDTDYGFWADFHAKSEV